MRWNQGRDQIEAMLQDRLLERVPPSRKQAAALVETARRHVASARLVAPSDPHGAYQLAYDAARKALAAVLENEGLRATRPGGHVAVYEAVLQQLDPPMGALIRPFNAIRRLRNQLEYASTNAPRLTPEDVIETLAPVGRMIDLANRVISEMDSY